jgi:glucose-6-phosphate isomerase
MTLSLEDTSKRLAEKDETLWGSAARATARERLGWIDLPENSRHLLPALDALSAWARSNNLTRIVLSGMGGSSLAPEVIALQNNRELILLDSTHPVDVSSALDPDPSQTIFVISSKSGQTIETLSHLKAIVKRIDDANLSLSDHVVVISDPGSPLEGWASEHGVRFFSGDAQVGGRFSALSIFGLLPSALLGIDCAELLDDAADMKSKIVRAYSSNADNPAIVLATEILARQPFLELPVNPLSDWIEQLVAESTGKDGVGITPIVSPRFNAESARAVAASFQAPLGGSFYLWEWTTALLGAALGVNAFDQPNVASAKEATNKALAALISNSKVESSEVSPIDSAVEATRAISELLKSLNGDTNHYLALLAFTPMRDNNAHSRIDEFRATLEQALPERISIGFGPRYLHSTGQCHKGGPDIGTFIILTLNSDIDYPIPGEPYTFNQLLTAQALGDFAALKAAKRKVIHLHLEWSELTKVTRSLREAF